MVKNPVVCAKFPVGSKFHFSKWKLQFTQFIDKFLKFEKMEYLIRHIKVEMWPALCTFPILFSAVKLKFRHNFSQFIYISKIGTFGSCTYASTFFPIHKARD